MIRPLNVNEKKKLHREIVNELGDQIIIIPPYTEFDDAERRGETLYYEYFEDYVKAIKHYYLSNYSEKPMALRAFRQATGNYDLEWKNVYRNYVQKGGRVFWGWSKERYIEEYPKASELPEGTLIETKYGLVRLKCDDFVHFPERWHPKVEAWELQTNDMEGSSRYEP